MKKYYSFFKMRFINDLQYRTAAIAGIATQFCWGWMTILMFLAFYQTGNNSNNFPMTFNNLTSYIWLQQAFLAIFMSWYFDSEIFDNINSGNVAYELCRPINVYNMYFIKNVAIRLSRTCLRFLPIIIISYFILPSNIGLVLPSSFTNLILFVFSLTLSLLVMVSFNMLIYISAFYTISSLGMRILSISIVEILSGAIIPLPFFPTTIRKIVELLPFASMQNTCLLIYTGDLIGTELIYKLFLQMFWVVILIIVGKIIFKNALKKVVIQGG